MNRIPDLNALADDIRRLHASSDGAAEKRIADRLDEAFGNLTESERLAAMDRLMARFGGTPEPPASLKKAVFAQAVSLILGERVLGDAEASPELLHRLAGSLNVVFEALNELIRVINGTLYGQDAGTDTIRHVIGAQLRESGDEPLSLEAYIEQIGKAFLDAQKACQGAVRAKVAEILDELDPKRIAETAKGLKFGPFQKAEFFRIYEERFEKCRKWFDSDRFKTDFLREFERTCHQLSKRKEA